MGGSDKAAVVVKSRAWETRRQRQPQKGDKLGRHSGCQEQPRKEIMKLGRQGDSDSQEQLRKETIKRDKLAKSSPEGKSERETSLRDKAAAAAKSSPGKS